MKRWKWSMSSDYCHWHVGDGVMMMFMLFFTYFGGGLVTKACLTLATPWTVACQAPLWDSPGKNTGVGCRSLLQRIFPTQGSNPGLLYCRQILYYLSYRKVSKTSSSYLCTPFMSRKALRAHETHQGSQCYLAGCKWASWETECPFLRSQRLLGP